MSIPDQGPRTDAQEAAQMRRYQHEEFERSYQALTEVCERVGKYMRGAELPEEAIAVVAEQLCEALYEHAEYRGCLADYLGDVDVYQDMEAVVMKAYKGEEQ